MDLELTRLYLMFILIILSFICAGIIFFKTKSPDFEGEIKYLYGVIVFLILHGVGRIFYTFHTWEMGAFISFTGVTILIFVVERYVLSQIQKTYFIFTALGIFTVITVLLPVLGVISTDLGHFVQNFTIPAIGLAIACIYLFIVIKTTGGIRKQAFWILIGIIMFLLGNAGEVMQSSIPLANVLAPIFMIIGIIVFTLAFLTM